MKHSPAVAQNGNSNCSPQLLRQILFPLLPPRDPFVFSFFLCMTWNPRPQPQFPYFTLRQLHSMEEALSLPSRLPWVLTTCPRTLSLRVFSLCPEVFLHLQLARSPVLHRTTFTPLLPSSHRREKSASSCQLSSVTWRKGPLCAPTEGIPLSQCPQGGSTELPLLDIHARLSHCT